MTGSNVVGGVSDVGGAGATVDGVRADVKTGGTQRKRRTPSDVTPRERRAASDDDANTVSGGVMTSPTRSRRDVTSESDDVTEDDHQRLHIDLSEEDEVATGAEDDTGRSTGQQDEMGQLSDAASRNRPDHAQERSALTTADETGEKTPRTDETGQSGRAHADETPLDLCVKQGAAPEPQLRKDPSDFRERMTSVTVETSAHAQQPSHVAPPPCPQAVESQTREHVSRKPEVAAAMTPEVPPVPRKDTAPPGGPQGNYMASSGSRVAARHVVPPMLPLVHPPPSPYPVTAVQARTAGHTAPPALQGPSQAAGPQPPGAPSQPAGPPPPLITHPGRDPGLRPGDMQLPVPQRTGDPRSAPGPTPGPSMGPGIIDPRYQRPPEVGPAAEPRFQGPQLAQHQAPPHGNQRAPQAPPGGGPPLMYTRPPTALHGVVDIRPQPHPITGGAAQRIGKRPSSGEGLIGSEPQPKTQRLASPENINRMKILQESRDVYQTPPPVAVPVGVATAVTPLSPPTPSPEKKAELLTKLEDAFTKFQQDITVYQEKAKRDEMELLEKKKKMAEILGMMNQLKSGDGTLALMQQQQRSHHKGVVPGGREHRPSSAGELRNMTPSGGDIQNNRPTSGGTLPVQRPTSGDLDSHRRFSGPLPNGEHPILRRGGPGAPGGQDAPRRASDGEVPGARPLPPLQPPPHPALGQPRPPGPLVHGPQLISSPPAGIRGGFGGSTGTQVIPTRHTAFGGSGNQLIQGPGGTQVMTGHTGSHVMGGTQSYPSGNQVMAGHPGFTQTGARFQGPPAAHSGAPPRHRTPPISGSGSSPDPGAWNTYRDPVRSVPQAAPGPRALPGPSGPQGGVQRRQGDFGPFPSAGSRRSSTASSESRPPRVPRPAHAHPRTSPAAAATSRQGAMPPAAHRKSRVHIKALHMRPILNPRKHRSYGEMSPFCPGTSVVGPPTSIGPHHVVKATSLQNQPPIRPPMPAHYRPKRKSGQPRGRLGTPPPAHSKGALAALVRARRAVAAQDVTSSGKSSGRGSERPQQDQQVKVAFCACVSGMRAMTFSSTKAMQASTCSV